MSRVIIVGGGITGLSAAWELQQQGIDYILLEGADRLGGKITTDRADGFIIEGAADSFLRSKPWAWQLICEMGMVDQLIGTNDEQRKTYILRGGMLHPIPRGMRLIVPLDPDGLIESEILSEEGKRRMLAEPDIPPRTETGDESISAFVNRRFGKEAAEIFADSLMAGIHVGHPERLSMQATFPEYLTMEREYGSVIRGIQIAPRPSRSTAEPGAPLPNSMFLSLKNGMYSLIEGLQARLKGDVRTGQTLTKIDADGTLHIQNSAGKEETLHGDNILLTIPTTAAGKLLNDGAPELADLMKRGRTVSSGTISFGFRAEDVAHPLDGFGFVVPGREPTHLLACTWSSTKLAHRAPEGHVLIRVFVGGHAHESDVELSDLELTALARSELQRFMGISAKPVITRIFRWRNANPQYEVGHLNRVARMIKLCPPWLHLAGCSYEGVGIPDCVRQGREIARNMAASS